MSYSVCFVTIYALHSCLKNWQARIVVLRFLFQHTLNVYSSYIVCVVHTFCVSVVVLVPVGLGQSGWSVCFKSNEAA